MNRLAALALLVAAPLASFAPREARADLPKPEGWKPSCSIEIAKNAGSSECEECRGWKDPDPCQQALEKKGYTRHCTEGGAGSYVAVWCKVSPNGANTNSLPPKPIDQAASPSSTAAPPPTVLPAADNRRGTGCGVGPGSSGAWEGLAAMVAIGLGLALTSRRSRRAPRDQSSPNRSSSAR